VSTIGSQSAGPPPQGGFQHVDPVEQVNDEAHRGVVQRERGPQPLNASHGRGLSRAEPQRPGGVLVGFERARAHQPAHQVGVQAREARERVGIEAVQPDQRVGHRFLLGSK
jgi:hypothetical protein